MARFMFVTKNNLVVSISLSSLSVNHSYALTFLKYPIIVRKLYVYIYLYICIKYYICVYFVVYTYNVIS